MNSQKTQKKPVLNPNLTKPVNQAFYGTAGYRLNTPDLNNVLCRASLIAYIRSATFAGKFIGLYITASHNPTDYNGIKFIDFNGNMLDEVWEQASDELVNCDDSDFNPIINKIFRMNSNYSNMTESIPGNIIIGRDTRESGVILSKNIEDVLRSYRCNVYNFGEVSCPEMHFLIRKSNEMTRKVENDVYIEYLYKHFLDLIKITKSNVDFGIDTANGVGKAKIEHLQRLKPDIGFEIINDPEKNILNKDCGADFIKTKNTVPKLLKTEAQFCAAFDGDVDRLILFTQDGRIFDGDAQCVFLADLIKKKLEDHDITCNVGIVLSYYSNSGAMDYLKAKGFPVVMTQTGVKNFVKESKKFDIGIYFEPNGHGSMHFSKKFLEKIEEKEGTEFFKILVKMFDPCVGDAVANLLVLKATLKAPSDMSRYKPNYSRLLTVRVKDKNSIKVDPSYVVLDPTIQRKIEEQILMYKGRAFVRPSGTEDLVRVYAESPNESDCDKLALQVAQIVYDCCDGIGPHPEISYNRK